jgi:hypothetical protein
LFLLKVGIVPWWELVSTRMAAAHGLVRAPARSRVRAPSSATLRLELLLLNTIPQGSSPAGLVFIVPWSRGKRNLSSLATSVAVSTGWPSHGEALVLSKFYGCLYSFLWLSRKFNMLILIRG